MPYNPFKTYKLDDSDEDLQRGIDEGAQNTVAQPSDSFDSIRASSSPKESEPPGTLEAPGPDGADAARATFNKQPNPVGLSPAVMQDQPTSSLVDKLRGKLEDQTQPMGMGKRIGLSLLSTVPIIGAPMARAIAGNRSEQIASTEKELSGAETQQNTEFAHDSALRQAMIQEADQNQRSLNDINARQRTSTATTWDNGLPATFQFNPYSGHFDTPMGAAKPPAPPFQIQRHPTTNAPIGILRRGGQVVYNPQEFTPDEKVAYDADNKAFQEGLINQRDLIHERGDDALTRTISAVTAATSAAMNRGSFLNQSNQVNGDYGEAMTASGRAKVMHQLLEQAQNGDAQADFALLANHLGMTMAQLKGARMNQALIEEAARARGYGNGDMEIGWLQKLMGGSILAPEERKQMVDLADQMEKVTWDKADKAAQLYGVPLPRGRSQIGPAQPGNPITQGAGSGNTQQMPPPQQDPYIGKIIFSKSLKRNVKITGKNQDGTYAYSEVTK